MFVQHSVMSLNLFVYRRTLYFMQRLYKNEKLLFKDFQDFLSRKQHIPEYRLPYYLRWVSRYHDFCSRENIDRDLGDGIAAHLQYPDRHHEDWQLQQAREALRRTDTSRECRGSYQRKSNSQTDRYRGKRKRKRSSGLCFLRHRRTYRREGEGQIFADDIWPCASLNLQIT
jgi:hypothetical protein